MSKKPTKIRKKKIEHDPIADRQAIRMYVRLRDDFQAMRKRVDNRIGRKADGTDQDIDERAFTALDLANFTMIADTARQQEAVIEKIMLQTLRRFPVYREYLAHCKGVGAVSAGWIIGEIDIHIATTVSKLWQFCGLNPGMVRGKKRKQIDTRKHEIILTDKMIPGDRLTPGYVAPFNKRLRTALVGVMGDSFIKAGIRGEDCTQTEYDHTPEAFRRMKGKQPQTIHAITPEAQTYLDYKHRLANSEKLTKEVKKGGDVDAKVWRDAKPAHRHRAAVRYMIKMWLIDLYGNWRGIAGLPVRPPYQDDKLGHKHANAGETPTTGERAMVVETPMRPKRASSRETPTHTKRA